MFRYVRLLNRLQRGEVLIRPSRLAIELAAALAIVGSAVSAYLLISV